MAENPNNNYELYMNYLGRNTNKNDVPISGVSKSEELTTDGLSTDITRAEVALFDSFPNVSFIADLLEESVIVVDDDGKETEESMLRRKTFLDKLNGTLESDSILFKKVRETYSTFGLNMDKKIDTEDFKHYSDVKTRFRRLCTKINSSPVSKTKEAVIIENEKIVELDSPISEYDELLNDIGKCIDSIAFNRACEIEKSFIKGEINEFKALSQEKMVEDEVATGMTRLEQENYDEIKKVNTYKDYYNGKLNPDRKKFYEDEYR